ncbi:MAG: TolC family protein [Sideroxyarcus sp.]|nr:TolC family protein [Sideroxyarcus sp.]
MKRKVGRAQRGAGKWGVGSGLLALALFSSFANATEINRPDLPPPVQIESALSNHLLVLNAASELGMEQANQRKWNSGPYEFNLRAGTGQRNVVSTGQNLNEWDVALERPLRLFNKVGIDEDIGAASVARAEYALGDARHEAGRTLLQLWFTWQRGQAQVALWQQQVDILKQQAQMADKRVKAGDAPRLELNQAQAAAAQAGVSWQQAQLRAQLAGNDLKRQFPAIRLPEKMPFASATLLAGPADCGKRRGDGIPAPDACAQRVIPFATPQAVEHDFAFWKSRVLEHNHELGMAQEQSRVQQLLAQRSRADQLPDPTVGMSYANEAGGSEKVAGVYLSMPISFGQRSATAEGVAQQAAIAADREAFVKRRVEGDVYAAYTQAASSYSTWQQALEAAQAMRSNAELVAKAYSLGESSLSDSLSARRFALESSLAEILAQLDANEARYRLLLDAHQLWPLNDEGEHHANHY